MNSLASEVFVILVLVIVNGVFAMMEIALISARKLRLQQQSDEGQRGAQIALELTASPNRFLSTTQIGITLIGVLAGAFGGATIAGDLAVKLRLIPWLAPYAGAAAIGIVVVAITFVSLVIGELVPKRIAMQHAEGIAVGTAPFMKALSWLAAPVVHLLSIATELVLKAFRIKGPGDVTVSEEEVKMMIEQGTQEGVFEPTEQAMVERVFRLGDRTVNALMTPRPDVVWLDPDEAPDEIQRKITTNGHNHYPVVAGQIDNILGLVNSKDLLSQNLSCQPIDLRAVLRPAMFVPETMSALDVLERFKKKRTHVAFVIDEHGGFQGLVTTSDLLEAIVGDIPTLNEAEEAAVTRRDDGSWLVDGAVIADEVKELMQVDELPFEDQNLYQTLGGLVMAFLERIPATGDHFEWKGHRIEVVDMDGHRVDKVLISPLPPRENA
jgi:putative hemolysin